MWLWVSVAGALRETAPGSALVHGLTAAPDLDGWTVVERLLEDLASLEDRVWLVVDDLHELHSAEALRQLELLIMRAQAPLRFVLATRHDLRLGLHRLRLAGELTEIRTADLRFSRAEARALLDAAGAPMSDSALALLYDRTEGWATTWPHGLVRRLTQARRVVQLSARQAAGRRSCSGPGLPSQGSLEEAERYLALATQKLESLPASRRGRPQVVVAVVRMRLARQRGDLPTVAEEAQRLLAPAVAADPAKAGLGEDLRALALIDLGIAELWTARFDDADRHLEDGVALARQLGRPYLEVTGLAHRAQLLSWRSIPLGAQRSQQAIELATRHGWADEPVAGVAYLALGVAMVTQGRTEEAERALDRAERTVRVGLEPAAGMRLHYGRGLLEFVSGRHDAALRAFQTAERVATSLVTPHTLAPRLRSHLLQTIVRIGETRRVEQALADMDGPERERAEIRIAEASLRLAQDDPKAATDVLAPVIDGSAPLHNAHLWEVQAFLLQAIACDALGDAGAARRALEQALDRAEPERLLLPFLYDPAPELLDRHRQGGTARAGLIAEILDVLAGRKPGSPPAGPPRLREPLSHAEARVLRYLPTKLSAPEVADELYLSVNTVKTHMRHLYDKLGAHRRHEAVEQARALGLLAPSPRRP